jgi:electron transfer flavoprotein beta subunit
MNIAVCIKQVPATDARIRISSNSKSIDYSDITLILNPYDEIAVEEALRTKEKFQGETTCISIGPEQAIDAIRTALAMGIDKAIHIKSNEVVGYDTFFVAYILAEVLKKNSYDIIFFGKQAVDDDNASVGIEVAQMLSLPYVSAITKLEIDIDRKIAKVAKEIEGGTQIIECPLPAIFTCQKGLNEPRYPSLPGIMKAKNKPLEVIEASQFSIPPKVVVENMKLPPAKKQGKIISGEVNECVNELIKYLKEEIKII